MQQFRFSSHSGFLLLLVSLFLAGCNQQEEVVNNPSSFYQEARELEGQKRYPEALERYNRGLAADTLGSFGVEALEALCRKGRIEYLTGRYEAAFSTWRSIEAHVEEGPLGDSLRTAAGVATARMYAELGRYGKAASVMASIGSADDWERYQIAVYLLRDGQLEQAARSYKRLSASADPSVKMAALAGLLDCSLRMPELVADSPERLAGRIAVVSAQVMKMNAPAIVKIRSLRIASKSLQHLESQQRNASYLLFRALGIARQEGFARLVPILQHESNSVIVRKPDTWRSVIEYFDAKNMHYAKAAALCELGGCEALTSDERIGVLRRALSACQYYGVPPTATGYLKMVKEAAGQLDELLIASGRFVELFDVRGQEDALEARTRLQASIKELRLPAGNEALQHEIITLSTGISGLLQRKIDMNEQGEGFRYASLVDRSITEKQGRLIELIAKVREIEPAIASALQPQPLTLSTLRQRLRPDQALVRFFPGESFMTAVMVTNREMHIETAPVTAAELNQRFVSLQQRILRSGSGSASRLLGDSGRLWLNDTLLKTMSVRLAAYRHLMFVSARPQPLHLLGRGEFLGHGRKISYLVSPNEMAYSSMASVGQDETAAVAFFDANRIQEARMYKLFHLSDRVMLAWKPLGSDEIESLETALAQAPPADRSAACFLKTLGDESNTEMGRTWYWLGAYGVD